MRFRLTFLLLLALTCPIWGADSPSWLQLPIWDDGLAEVCLYEGRQLKYGKLRDSSLEIITVREHFDPQQNVKTRPAVGKAVFPIMKQNLVRRTRTGVYEYMQMASVFINRDSGLLAKMSTVSMEWCGNSFCLFEQPSGQPRLLISNYMDDRGTSAVVDPLGNDAVFYEQLVPWLRQQLPSLRPGYPLRVARPLMDNNPRLVIDKVTLVSRENRSDETVLSFQFPTHAETYVLSQGETRFLKEWRGASGQFYRLTNRLMMDYWNRNQPGDEQLLGR